MESLRNALSAQNAYRPATSSSSAFQASLYVPPSLPASPFPSPRAAGSGPIAPVAPKARPLTAAVRGGEASAEDVGGNKPAGGVDPPRPLISSGEAPAYRETKQQASLLFGEGQSPAFEGHDRILEVLSKRLEQHERLINTQMRRIQELEGQLLSWKQARLDTCEESDLMSPSSPGASAVTCLESSSSRSSPGCPPCHSPLSAPSPSPSLSSVSALASARPDSRAPGASSSLGRPTTAQAQEKRETVLRERSLPSTPVWRFLAFSSVLLQLVSVASVPAVRTFFQRLRLWFSRKASEGRAAGDASQTVSPTQATPITSAGDCGDANVAVAVASEGQQKRCCERHLGGDSPRDSECRTIEHDAAVRRSPQHAPFSSGGQGARPDGRWGSGQRGRSRLDQETSQAPVGTTRGRGPSSASQTARHGSQEQLPVSVSGVGVIDQILNDERVATLLSDRMCRMRGAALKLMQMVSMIEGSLPPVLTEALKKTRDSADIMPEKQLLQTLREELGANWQDHFAAFSLRPFAAASIGQVHRATLRDGQEVAVKVQFPGVASSIASDLRNLKALVQWTRLLPRSLFLDVLCDEMRAELLAECDYGNELAFYRHFRELLHRDFAHAFYVPRVFPDCSTKRILVTEFIRGLSLEQVGQQMPQHVRDSISERLVRLVLAEIFLYRLMNTDPNPSNFFYLPDSDSVALIDFGAGRTYDPQFIDKYLQLLHAAVEERAEVVRRLAGELGFFGRSSTAEFLHAQGNVFLAFALCFRPPKVFAETVTAYRAPDGGPFRPAASLDTEKA
ncbi:putative ABC1 domain-containing protein [Neospora caninum Liverpool]|uniref:Putative ABC1 domain-containing protein n=1 Tax=Neospora caninum (strain Liverpool) TaxID=572307 RepID=F0VF33_NEOCL|nr:putative ABC1 domain-containing protein [Neospora caninum Liverpool]CBZ52327.1 putative ABC1 domain-containing protein [Neospora caninum Liverpool]|eukprot:XP_003882359.1 putative ABC1 domain-containing protein [Neospora caninum Liverpool]